MAAGKINLQKASGGITAITGVDGTGNTQLVLPESGTVATTAGATETSTGLIELATTAETQAGTDDTRAITPLKLKNSVLGLGQTWQDVTASRAIGTTYTNSTGKPIYVKIACTAPQNVSISPTVAGIVLASGSGSFTPGARVASDYIVPNGATYSITGIGGSLTSLLTWSELR